ncbi:MAG TPA: RIO1 family regulatory kinase/ATPase [archaeon]|nr:RIO1 family regulatory kinase/ATPase [archaeon]
MNTDFEKFLSGKKLFLVEKISKGWSSEIFLVKNQRGKKFALKIEKKTSPRIRMAEKEAENLRCANAQGIGPKLAGFDFEKRIVLMEFIEGIPFGKWFFQNPSKKQLQKCIDSLLEQAKKLDAAGLSHGQLAGKGANILVKKNSLPVIIDFEKASQCRKCNNRNQLEAFLFRNPNSAIAKKISEILNSLAE